MRFPILLLTSAIIATTAPAHNNYFLPGDAFFSISISRKDIAEWTASEADTLNLPYDRFDGEFFACGNVGYSNLSITGITPEFRTALAEAYWHFTASTRPLYREEEDDGKPILQQVNSVVALIYSKDFDINHKLGLKYNENWNEQGAGRYGGYLTTAQPVAYDWRFSTTIPPLPIQEKLNPTAHLKGYEVSDTVEEPLHIKADDIMIVLVGFAQQDGDAVTQRCPGLQSIFEGAIDARYMVVTKTKLREFGNDEENGWSEYNTIELPVPEGHSMIPTEPLTPATTR